MIVEWLGPLMEWTGLTLIPLLLSIIIIIMIFKN